MAEQCAWIHKNLKLRPCDTIGDRLVDTFEPRPFTVYRHCFNMQKPEGWPELNAKLESDERLKLA